ncbi:MAG TPA: kelch repeat-containing protein, partial [Candidatus Limnocylindrales bacterium]
DVDPPTIGHALATAELFDPATGAWSRTGSLRYARYGAVAVTLADGRVLVAGSEPGSGVAAVAPDAALTAELYDPATGRFTATGRLPAISLSVMFPSRPKWADEFGDPAPYANGTLVPLANGDALLVGNTWWWKHQGEVSRQLRYMAATGTWALAGPAWFDGWTHTDGSSWTSGSSRYDAIAALLADGRVLVAGGSTGIQYEGVVGRSTALYEPATGRWTAGPAMPAPRAGAAAARLPSGDVLVVGGYTSDDDRWQNCEHAGGTAVTLRFAP